MSTPQIEHETPAPSDVTSKPEVVAQPVSVPQPVVHHAVSENSQTDTAVQSISPAAKRLATQMGVRTAGLNGSGPNGRIILADIQKAMSVQKPA